MRKKITKLFLFAVIILGAISCSCPKCSKQENISDVPNLIYAEADIYLSQKTGEKFFEEYIYRNYSKAKALEGKYEVHYALTDPDRPYVYGDIYFYLDTDGKILEEYEQYGIPQCKAIPETCEFNLDKDEALSIAKEAGLAEGIRPWDAAFRWSAELNMYIWHILSTTSERGKKKNYKASGEEIMISPYNGEVLKHRKWNIF